MLSAGAYCYERVTLRWVLAGAVSTATAGTAGSVAVRGWWRAAVRRVLTRWRSSGISATGRCVVARPHRGLGVAALRRQGTRGGRAALGQQAPPSDVGIHAR